MCGDKMLDSFITKYKNKFPTSSIIILEEVGINNLYVIVETSLGLCKIRKGHLMNGVIPSINTALNKNEYYSNKANLIHNFKYTYDFINYTTAHNKITITCKIHGNFLQEANDHLNKKGCPKCKNIKSSILHSNNPTGWSEKNWEKSAKESKNFHTYKIYIIKCWNDFEEFYKIGRTFQTIEKRFKSKKEMPYNYSIIKIIEDSCNKIYNLENKLKKMNKDKKYKPLIKFNGYQECFSNIAHIW